MQLTRRHERIANDYFRHALEDQGLPYDEVIDAIERFKGLHTLRDVRLQNKGFIEELGYASWRIGLYAFETDPTSVPTFSDSDRSPGTGMLKPAPMNDRAKAYLSELAFRSKYKIEPRDGHKGDKNGRVWMSNEFFVAEGGLILPDSGQVLGLTVSMPYRTNR